MNIQENKYYKLLISYFQAHYNVSSKRFYHTMSDIEQLLVIYNLPSALGDSLLKHLKDMEESEIFHGCI